MDILSHGLWTAAAAKAANEKRSRPLHVGWTAFWGVFPDLFAFTIPFSVLILNLVRGRMNIHQWPQPTALEPASREVLAIFQHTRILYSISHSAVVFFAVFLVIRALRNSTPWEMLGWLFHILIDIPTHSYRFYPTPFLWPISGWRFDGISWGTPWFLVLNYASLAIVYTILFIRRKRATPTP